MELLASHRLFQTNDLDNGRAFASQIWEKHSSQLKNKNYAMTWNQAALRRSSLSFVDHPCAVTARCEGPLSDIFRILFHLSGCIDHSISGKPASSQVAQVVVHAPSQELKLDIAPFSLLMLNLDGEMVRLALDRRLGKIPNFESWVTELATTSPSIEGLRSLCFWAAGELDNPQSPILTSAAVAANLERTLLSLFIESLAELRFRGEEPLSDLNIVQVRHAEEWIDANLASAIAVEDVATAIGVSPRALQTAFRRVRGCSPSNAIFRRRLERARAALIAASPSDTVTKIATDLGFFELGRFSVRYREEFGEKPSETLARSLQRSRPSSTTMQS
ncbi:MAG: helix-turn-helix domain-containing protein [Xanthobacteraceae bacterium]